MKNPFLGNISKINLWVDILLLNIAYFISGAVLFKGLSAFQDIQYLNILLIANLLWVLCIYLFNVYSFVSSNQYGYSYFGKLILMCGVHFILIEIILYISDSSNGFKENLVFTAFEIFAISVLLVHIVIKNIMVYLRKFGFNLKRYAIIAEGNFDKRRDHFYKSNQEIGHHFCGIFNLRGNYAQIDALEKFIEEERVDFLYCYLSEMNKGQITKVLKLAERKRTQVRLIPDFHGLPTGKFNFGQPDMYPIIHVETKPFSGINEQLIKRTFDLVFSSIVMIVGLPVFLLIMAAVKISSKGPVFFLQKRTGRWGETFNIIKFRTMYTDAERYGLQHSLGDNDPRITPIGYYLRKTRLDELPQFLNVLKGEMSVVGPRPLHQYDVDMLMKEASHEFQRMLTIRPGITSIGQIKVGYATNSSENLTRLKYDMVYLNTYSLLKDVYLIFLTIQVVLLGKGR
ncbi:exopolysaccharide biosynthesis polyprenyl glycosylphosphotransferase [Dyadobacter sp. CY323]|uniref:exopolysaccharide biosynthesis polyprenyl glycosylphosphotransferase n=1 Tax=Dyadobacter sp. CY323 TaxID=2907302 RepID=UPI001F2EAA72|nr:exopolysaccharide biosynthesis polyprenyl glycosylphosphotransferase [Dyadobacter sp. CY323]MCE6992658.1 exopolysaccharide biosynthesis polyprenyl glycosylphosphotransferase [Dyadobacter sp. CY323]